MKSVCQARNCALPSFSRWPLWGAIAVVAASMAGGSSCQGQLFLPGMSSPVELGETIQVAAADAESKVHLERAHEFCVNGQLEEAIDAWMLVLANASGKVAPLTERRYIGLRDYCHLQIARLPAEGLAIYRSRVDPEARKLLEQGLARHDVDALRSIVRDLFCSSSGDQALDSLAELAFERGDYAAARGYWERLIPPRSPAAAAEGTADEAAPAFLAYPDTDLDVAGIRARSILAAIFEGDDQAAQRGMKLHAAELADTEGTIGGRKGKYAELLHQFAAEAQRWPRPAADGDDWPSFAGGISRQHLAARPIEPARVRWQAPLEKPPAAEPGQAVRRVGEDRTELLSYHPIVHRDVAFVNNLNEVLAFDLETGAPAWGTDPRVYRSEESSEVRRPRGGLGVARFTMTAHAGRLYARMGFPVTCVQQVEPLGKQASGYLVCLDLEKQGALAWKSPPTAAGWAYEGSPICDGDNVFVAMRRSDVRPLAHVACLDAATGRERWRTFVCGAETPGQGQYDETTHGLLTLHGDTLYFNTNLGAVAALDVRDGQVRWLTLYPRATTADLERRAAHFFRDLNPCVYWRGLVFAAPSDSRYVVALDAATGLVAWQTHHAEDAVHLLGVGGGNLLASGSRLWWLQAETGKAVADPWPDGGTPRGFGRGLLAGDAVYFPTRDKIHVFDQSTAQKRREIELSPLGVAGGNLSIVGDTLLIAGHKQLWALDARVGAGPPAAAPSDRQP